MKFAFIHAEKASFSIVMLCRVLGVSRSGYHAWAKRAPSKRAMEEQALAVEVAAVHAESRGIYGSPRVHDELRRQRKVGRRRVARVMRSLGLKSKRRLKFRATTDSNHAHPIAGNVLDRDFKVDAPNKAWVGDITYVWTREGWLYLAVILDLYSRAVVGWATSSRLDRGLALDALDMALGRRERAAQIHHTDRGCQYASRDYRERLERNGITCSMSRKGNCWDNAVSESFFATVKTELVHHEDFATRAQARSALFEFIEVFYHRRRRHSYLGYDTPEEFERKFFQINKAA